MHSLKFQNFSKYELNKSQHKLPWLTQWNTSFSDKFILISLLSLGSAAVAVRVRKIFPIYLPIPKAYTDCLASGPRRKFYPGLRRLIPGPLSFLSLRRNWISLYIIKKLPKKLAQCIRQICRPHCCRPLTAEQDLLVNTKWKLY